MNFKIHNFLHILDVLKSGADDFENSDEVYEAIGEILHEVSDKSEEDIRQLCFKFHTILKPQSNGTDKNLRKILAAPGEKIFENLQ